MNDHKTVFRSICWNALGLGLPLIVAVIAFPLLIDGMGTERFGVLLLAWMIVGYFSVFDLGLGRAVTKLVAEKLGTESHRELPALIWTSLLLMLILGLVNAFVFALISPKLVTEILKIPPTLVSESLEALRCLTYSIPIVVISSGLAGVLEAHQRFGLVNAVRLPLGLGTFLVPLMILPFSTSLVAFVVALVAVRALAAAAYFGLCLYVVVGLRSKFVVVPAVIPGLLRLGGWMTVSNIVSPLMVYLDRFFVGAAISMAAVTYYTTPYEVVTRALLLPRAIMGVLFPAFSSAMTKDPDLVVALYRRWRNYLFSLMFPFALVVVTLAHDILKLWLGDEFSRQSTLVLQLLAVGVLVNSLAQLSFGLIQSNGRADITAKIHIFELPFYLFALWWLVERFGINGAAMAWLLRVSVDALALSVAANRQVELVSVVSYKSLAGLLFAVLTLLAGALLPDFSLRLLYTVFGLFIFAVFAWSVLLEDADKQYLRSKV